MLRPPFLLCATLLAAVGASPSPATTDRNLDGVSDLWSAAYPTAGAPFADPDGDGADNHSEALAGTDPFVATSRFAATPEPDAAGAISLRWRRVAGKRYTVETSTNLHDWTEFPATQATDGDDLRVLVDTAGEGTTRSRFWRIAVADHDADGDGLNDWEETQLATDPARADSDGDGFSDGWEAAYGFDPRIAETGPREVRLWDGPAPIGDGTTEPSEAYNVLTLHRADGGDGAAFVVCPGGGYAGWMLGAEGYDVATWLQSHDITGCVLRYRLPHHRSEVPLLDAQRALRFLRAHARDLGLDPHRIGIMGFSAGGHLAGTAATLHDVGDPLATDPVERVSSRPDFAVLVYPLVSMTDALTHSFSRDNLFGPWAATPALIQRFSVELNVTAATPPMYLAHAVDDAVVPIDNSRALAAALASAGTPHVLLELPDGGHGLQYQGNYYQGPSWDAWQAGSLAWLAALWAGTP